MLTHPDAEQLFIDYLSPILAVPVGTKAPGGTNEFLRLFRSGGPRASLVVDQPQITIDAYSTRGSKAWELVEKARIAMFALAGTRLGEIGIKSVVELGGPANAPDPVFPSLTRYTFTLAVQLRGINKESP